MFSLSNHYVQNVLCSGVSHTDYKRESLCVTIYVGDAELYNFFLQQTNPPTCLSSEITIRQIVILCVHEGKTGHSGNF